MAWAAVIVKFVAAAFVGFIAGNILLTMYAASEHPLWLWWTIPLNILSVTGILAWADHGICDE